MSPQMKDNRKVPGAMNFFLSLCWLKDFLICFLLPFRFCSVDYKSKRSSLNGDSVSTNLFKVFHFDLKHATCITDCSELKLCLEWYVMQLLVSIVLV